MHVPTEADGGRLGMLIKLSHPEILIIVSEVGVQLGVQGS